MIGRWPVVLDEGDLRLRAMHRRDRRAWENLRHQNSEWLQRWEPTSPLQGMTVEPFSGVVRASNRRAKQGFMLPFAIDHCGELVGQVTFYPIIYGAARTTTVGYWISEHVAGRGFMPTAVAMGVDYCMRELDLHRVEANVRPENGPSIRVIEKLGFRMEGLRERFLHIDGDWRDHHTYALTKEDVPGGLLARLRKG